MALSLTTDAATPFSIVDDDKDPVTRLFHNHVNSDKSRTQILKILSYSQQSNSVTPTRSTSIQGDGTIEYLPVQ